MPYIGKQPANVPVTADDIPANSIDASKIIDGAITIADIADDAVTADKLANSINTAIAANTAKTGITSSQANAITANTEKVTNSTSASDLSSGTLPIARIADNAITLAKMASGTDGNIISYDASGNPVAIATGSDGQVLTSAGAGQPPAFETASSFDADAAQVFNESGADVDFRVESDGLTHALFVEGGNGRVGVNTDSPAYSIHMVGDRLMTENLSNGNTGIFMRVKNGGSQVGNATIRTNNNGDISIYQGTSSEALRATLKQGGGICFNSDTAAANALDDYEEGTFTFAMYAGQTGTITNTYAQYTKIGRNVTVNFRGTINGAQNNSFVRTSGLPFALNDTRIAVTAYYSNRQSIALAFSAGGYWYYQNDTVGGNNQGENAAWLDAATGITFQATYMV